MQHARNNPDKYETRIAPYNADAIHENQREAAQYEAEQIAKRIKLANISNVKIAGIDHADAPDYVDAYIESADITIDGATREMTEAEIEWVQDNHADFVYEQVMKWLY